LVLTSVMPLIFSSFFLFNKAWVTLEEKQHASVYLLYMKAIWSYYQLLTIC
jgi:hypothetical protein